MSMSNTEKTVKGIHRNTRRKFSTEEKKGRLDGLENQVRASRRHWNRIPGSVRRLVVEMALDRSDLTPRELVWHITDTHDYFVSESSVYHILKAHDLITTPQLQRRLG